MADQALMISLYARRKANRNSPDNKVLIRSSGNLEMSDGAGLTSEDYGSFTGKQGTMRRSRKGRTTRMPNGSRRYISTWAPENEVVAYKI